MTARRGRLSRLPRSWGTPLLSGQRAPAAPVTKRKKVRRGERRSAVGGWGGLGGVYRMWLHNPNRGGKDLLVLLVEFLHAFSNFKKENTFMQSFNRESPRLCWTVKRHDQLQLQWPEPAGVNSLKLPARGMAAGAQPPPPVPNNWESTFLSLPSFLKLKNDLCVFCHNEPSLRSLIFDVYRCAN